MKIFSFIILYVAIVTDARRLPRSLHPSNYRQFVNEQYNKPEFIQSTSEPEIYGQRYVKTNPSKNYQQSGLDVYSSPSTQPQQLFNVGYSVRFSGHQPQTPKETRPVLDQGDIITGVRKHNVQVEAPRTSYSKPLKDVRKRKLSGIKTTPPQSFDSKTLASQAIFSSTTQKHIEALENIKDNNYQEDLSKLYQQKYTWNNLSPNVKIVKSTEIPFNSENLRYQRNPQFDHEKALSRSEGFGFRDAIRPQGAENDTPNSDEAYLQRFKTNQQDLIRQQSNNQPILDTETQFTEDNLKSTAPQTFGNSDFFQDEQKIEPLKNNQQPLVHQNVPQKHISKPLTFNQKPLYQTHKIKVNSQKVKAGKPHHTRQRHRVESQPKNEGPNFVYKKIKPPLTKSVNVK